MAQVKIQFVEDYEVQDEHRGTDQATRYKKGQTLTVGEASARHFVEARGAAQRVAKRPRARPPETESPEAAPADAEPEPPAEPAA